MNYGGEDMAFHRALLQRKEGNIKIYWKKKKKSEGTGYQGHIDKKKLKIALKERKHINANKPVCGLRAWKKTHLLTKQR